MPVRVVLTNLGSLGNIQPFLVLAHEMRRTGYRPILAVGEQYAQYVRNLGFDFTGIGTDFDYRNLQKRDTAGELRGINPLDLLTESLPIFADLLPKMFSELSEACRHADVLISGHLQPVSRMIHEITNIPFVSIHTNHFGELQPEAYRRAACSVINPFRRKHNLPPICDPIHTDANSPQLALYAISRYLRPRGSRWPEHYHVSGFMFPEEDAWQPKYDPKLLAFLAAGPPPVVFSFSSVVHEDPVRMTKLLIDSIEGLGCRAVIVSGWSGLSAENVPSSVYVTDFVQHSWLFPRSACVIHAGGSGTTAMTLRSGIPAVIVPHVGDQPLWADLIRGIGCAKFVIPYRELTAERLREAVAATLSDQSLSRAAIQMARKIRKEHGVVMARKLIERLLQRLGVIACGSDGLDPVEDP